MKKKCGQVTSPHSCIIIHTIWHILRVSTTVSVDTVGSFPHSFAQHHHLQLVT